MGRNDNVATVRINGQPIPIGPYRVITEQWKGCIDGAILTVIQESNDHFTGSVCILHYLETLRSGTTIDAVAVAVRDERCDGKSLQIESSAGVVDLARQSWTTCPVVASDPKRILQQARQAVVKEYRAGSAAMKAMEKILATDGTRRLQEKLGAAMGGAGIGLGRSRRTSFPEVYFETARNTIRPEEAAKLDEVIRAHRGGGLIIEGHADVRGSAEANYTLGHQRATAVKTYLEAGFRKVGIPVPTLTITSHGEGGASASANPDEMARDRRVTILPTTAVGPDPVKRVVLERGLAAVQGDVYLIDASGSMSDVWLAVRQYQFPKGSQQFSFNNCGGVTPGIPSMPDCGTPLWESVLVMVRRIERGKTLTVVTDGQAGGFALDSLITLAKQKRIRINFVRIGGEEEGTDELRRVAQATGGKYYVRQ